MMFNISLVFFIITLINAQQSCVTPSNRSGSCIVMRNCKLISNYIASVGGNLSTEDSIYIRNSICGIENRQHKICCPILNPNVITTRATTTTTTARITTTTTSRTEPFIQNLNGDIASRTGRNITDTESEYDKNDIPNHPKLSLIDNPYCGQIMDAKMAYANTTEPFEFPWMAIIQYQTSKGIQQFCGGSIINKRYILTAAHCIDTTTNAVSVVVGEHNTTSEIDCVSDSDDDCAPEPVTIQIEELIPHPNFRPRLFVNDIGLIRLAEDIEYSDSVRPICLPVVSEALNFNFSKVKVTGWGKTENKTVSTALLQAFLPIVDNNTCKRKYSPRVRITSTHMCAGYGGADSCNGDSGGPAIFPAQTLYDTRYVQFGIVSSGSINCGSSLYPGLYTRVVPYMSWILETIHD